MFFFLKVIFFLTIILNFDKLFRFTEEEGEGSGENEADNEIDEEKEAWDLNLGVPLIQTSLNGEPSIAWTQEKSARNGQNTDIISISENREENNEVKDSINISDLPHESIKCGEPPAIPNAHYTRINPQQRPLRLKRTPLKSSSTYYYFSAKPSPERFLRKSFRDLEEYPPHNISNGTRSHYELNSEIVYSCKEGYYPVIINSGSNNNQSTLVGPWQTRVLAKCLLKNNTAHWYSTEFGCYPKSCGHPGLVTNGQMKGSQFTFHHKVQYICLPGYYFKGDKERRCQSNGLWTGTVPTCYPVRCGMPERFRNGKVMGTGDKFGNTLHYECDRGFILVGSKDRRCQEDGIWFPKQPICQVVDCGYPGDLVNGFLQYNSTSWGSVVIFWCTDMALFHGLSQSATCRLDGTWSYPLPQCLAHCTVPVVPNVNISRGMVPGSSIPHGDQLFYSCAENYEPRNLTSSTCENGSFVPALGCDPESCKELPPRIRNGRSIVIRSTHGSSAKYVCDSGYKIESSDKLVCRFGKWRGPLPICAGIYCPYPGDLNNGHILLVGAFGEYDYREYIKNVQHDRQIAYKCIKGYYISDGPPGSTCINGKWVPPNKPICISDLCPELKSDYRQKVRLIRHGNSSLNLPEHNLSGLLENLSGEVTEEIPTNSSKKASEWGDGAVAEITCIDARFELTLNTSIVNCVRGKWKPDWPACVPKTCPVPGIKNGFFMHEDQIIPEGFKIPHRNYLMMVCAKGFIPLTDNDKFTCIMSRWKPQILPVKCLAASCKLPALQNNGTYGSHLVPGDIIDHGESRDFKCPAGMEKNMNKEFLCLYGEFKPKPPDCIQRSCSLRNLPSNLDVKIMSLVPNQFPHRTVLEFSCPRGHKLVGNMYVTCLDGKWNYDTPDCVLVKCMPPYVPSFGTFTMTHDEEGYIAGTSIIFSCWEGYYLKGPQEAICQEDGFWGNKTRSCIKIEDKYCKFPTQILNSTYDVITNSRTFNVTGENSLENVLEIGDGSFLYNNGTSIQFTCKVGIKPYKTWVSICTSGIWTNLKPADECSPKNCSILPKSSGMTSYLDGILLSPGYGKTVPHHKSIKIRCQDVGKYQFSGSKILQCQDGEWKVPPHQKSLPPKCHKLPGKPMDTYLPSDPQIGIQSSNNKWLTDSDGIIVVSPGESIVLTCWFPRLYGTPVWKWNTSSDYYPVGWSQGMNKEVNGSPRDYEYLLNIPVARENDSGLYTCLTPYKNSHYVHIIVKDVRCKIPAIAESGLLVSPNQPLNQTGSYELSSKIKFACAEGFRPEPVDEIQCEPDGEWTNPLPTCQTITCPDIKVGPDSSVIIQPLQDSNIYNSVITFACPKGSLINGPTHIICQFNGQWSANIPNCIDIYCPEPVTIVNGYYSVGNSYTHTTYENISFKYGTQIVYKCYPGYTLNELTGSKYTKCLESGQWSNENSIEPQLPKCIKDIHNCTIPKNLLPNGRVDPEAIHTFIPGQIIRFTCKTGYERRGFHRSKCLPKGLWSKKFPTCHKI